MVFMINAFNDTEIVFNSREIIVNSAIKSLTLSRRRWWYAGVLRVGVTALLLSGVTFLLLNIFALKIFFMERTYLSS